MLNKKPTDAISFDFQSPIGMEAMKSCIEKIEQCSFLFDEKHFKVRMEAIDFIEFHLIDQLDGPLPKSNPSDELLLLKGGAEKLRQRLESVNKDLFQKIRENIIDRTYSGNQFRQLIENYVEIDADEIAQQQEATSYDILDDFVDGLMRFGELPELTLYLEPEMVYYQKTPARIVLELATRAQFANDDVFFDLGSGLGQVAILIHLLRGIKTCGVEFDPELCNYARASATRLHLGEVSFIQSDARHTDYSKGTAFFMFTPFEGNMLQAVLAALKKESEQRKIRLFTYGPCTPQVAAQRWLNFLGPDVPSHYKLGAFVSQ